MINTKGGSGLEVNNKAKEIQIRIEPMSANPYNRKKNGEAKQKVET